MAEQRHMTEEERQRIFQKAEELALEAKRTGDPNFFYPGDPWENDSLAKVINTPEKAERFMRELKWAEEKANKK
jgi:hypothetical protein